MNEAQKQTDRKMEELRKQMPACYENREFFETYDEYSTPLKVLGHWSDTESENVIVPHSIKLAELHQSYQKPQTFKESELSADMDKIRRQVAHHQTKLMKRRCFKLVGTKLDKEWFKAIESLIKRGFIHYDSKSEQKLLPEFELNLSAVTLLNRKKVSELLDVLATVKATCDHLTKSRDDCCKKLQTSTTLKKALFEPIKKYVHSEYKSAIKRVVRCAHRTNGNKNAGGIVGCVFRELAATVLEEDKHLYVYPFRVKIGLMDSSYIAE